MGLNTAVIDIISFVLLILQLLHDVSDVVVHAPLQELFHGEGLREMVEFVRQVLKHGLHLVECLGGATERILAVAFFADETILFFALDESLPELFFVLAAQLPRLAILLLPDFYLLRVLLHHVF